jgi:hypothetical protein
MEKENLAELRELRRTLIKYFNESELKNLCFDLAIDYETLPGQSKPDRVRELITYVKNREQISDLVREARENRPDVDWSGIMSLIQRPPSQSSPVDGVNVKPPIQRPPSQSSPGDNGEDIRPDQVLHDRYRIIRKISKGEMGRVYQAEHTKLGRPVAIKEAIPDNPELLATLGTKARLLANLKHPALPHVIDYFTEAHRQYLVMDFVHGDNLREMLKKGESPFPVQTIANVKEVLGWAEQLLQVLEYLHSQKPDPIIHQDIKPENIKLKPGNKVMLLDFGLEIAFNKSIVNDTHLYASPEQIAGAGIDARSDLYSLAATLHHLLTGEAPQRAPERQNAFAARQPDPQHPAHDLNPVVPEAVGKWLLQAMALKREQRPTSAGHMLTGLKRIVVDPPPPPGVDPPPPPGVDPPPPPGVDPPPPPRWLIKILAGVSGVLIVLLLVRFSPLPEVIRSIFAPAPPYQDQLIYATEGGELYAIDTANVIALIDPSEHNSGGTGITPRQLTTTSKQDRSPAISPDGRCLAFHSDREGNREIYVKCANDTEPRRLTNHPRNDQRPVWSPEGNRLAFVSNRDGVSQIYTMDVDDPDELEQLTNFAADDQNVFIGDLDWSKAGIVFERDRDIWRMDADGASLENLTDSPDVDDIAPAWSPDTTKIAFASDQEGDELDIFVMNADGSNPDNLTNNPEWVDTTPTWSSDGRYIAFRSARDLANSEIYGMNADGSNQINLTNTDDIEESDPVWSPRRAEP